MFFTSLMRLVFACVILQCVINHSGWCETAGEGVIVRVKQGDLMGWKRRTVNKQTPFHSFQGIPYAQPPTGDLRFMPPKPLVNWEGIFNATNGIVRCPQEDPLVDRFPSGEEDCLVLNVYTPSILQDESSRLPVMFWIHGGGFSTGSSSTQFYGPDFFMNENVVLVTTNYRLGALGFLNSEDNVVPGNMGLKDIVLALKWVQDNIYAFNGNKDLVTIFGSNAGGAAVSLLMHSPLAAGTFHKAICQSGVFELPHLFSANPRQRAFKLDKLLFKNSDTSEELLRNLKKVGVHEIVKTTPRTYDSTEVRDNQKSILPFGPSVENVTTEDTFLSVPPERLYDVNILNINIPLMIGFNSKEAISFLRTLINDPDILEKLDYNFQFSVPLRGLQFVYNSDDYRYVAQRIKNFYFRNGLITNTSMTEYVEYVSDSIFYPIHKTLTKHLSASSADTYFYRFSFDGSLNFFKNFSLRDGNSIRGATNGDEICYLFKCDKLDDTYRDLLARVVEPDELLISEQMVRLWTNFAKFGNPTPLKDDVLGDFVWKPASREEHNFLDIDKKLAMGSNPGSKNVEFWDGIFAKYTKTPLMEKAEL